MFFIVAPLNLHRVSALQMFCFSPAAMGPSSEDDAASTGSRDIQQRSLEMLERSQANLERSHRNLEGSLNILERSLDIVHTLSRLVDSQDEL
uniref:t-SNARE coiled-coil homology domain-containing protein n=1 Tax=Steinernema glaseri TaxID=37863 RepID=A0A1I7ZF50_9BILA